MNHILQARPSSTAPYATKPEFSRGRRVVEPPSPTRTEFQRDRDRIIHSGGFRKLRNKTQVFIENEGDYYRTRLTHSLEVAQIARSVSRVLGLDEDLAETIALAHDLGHTCFGHAGEDALHDAMKPYGGFSHNEQTFRILTVLEKNYARFDGLNLTWETLEGVVKHNGPILDISHLPTLRSFNAAWDLELNTYAGPEAQVAAIADDIAYNTHDVDDGYRAGLLHFEDLTALPLFGESLSALALKYPQVELGRLMHEAVREVIGLLVTDLLKTTQHNLQLLQPQNAADIRAAKKAVVGFSEGMLVQLGELRKFLHANMYRHEKVLAACDKARTIVSDLFAVFIKAPNLLPPEWAQSVTTSGDSNAKARMISDYIAGMTDRYAIQEHRRLVSADTKD
jgi:dGTPase